MRLPLASWCLPLLLAAAPAQSADARCAGTPAAAASRFSARALPGQSPQARYAAYVEACALDRVVALTRKLVAFRTVSSEAPAGKSREIAAMGRFLEAWGARNGLAFRRFGEDAAFEVSWGTGAPLLGFVLHGDVVPAPAHEWKRPPFAARVEDGRLYGRGVEDDKGPLAATLVAVAMAREVGLAPRGRVVVAVGNGEESDWSGMQAYARETPHPTHVVSVDADFPVVAAQSGFVAWSLEAAVDGGARGGAAGVIRVVDAAAGEFLTQVPGTARMTLAAEGTPPAALAERVRAAAAELRKTRPTLSAEVEVVADGVHVTTHGKAVHTSVAADGQNALWDLAAVAARLPLAEGGLEALLRTVAEDFDGDLGGERLGLAYTDTLMGPLLVVPSLLRVEAGKATLGINMRAPRGRDAAACNAALDAAAARVSRKSGGRVHEGQGRYVGEAHVADTSGPLVTTLLDIYRRHRNAPGAQPISVRGGTYARLFPRAVDFGPGVPGETYMGHAPDEFMTLEALQSLTEMLAEALHTLAVRAPEASLSP